jgi:prevent-host-death family protein
LEVIEMKSAAVSQLKASLSEYLSFVKDGEEVLITERGKPIAKVVPIDGASKVSARRMELARRGIIRLGRGRVSEETAKGLPVVNIPQDVLAGIMDEVREED